MQMQNGKISLRQYKRLLFFDMVGLGLVILPDLLAAKFILTHISERV